MSWIPGTPNEHWLLERLREARVADDWVAIAPTGEVLIGDMWDIVRAVAQILPTEGEIQ